MEFTINECETVEFEQRQRQWKLRRAFEYAREAQWRHIAFNPQNMLNSSSISMAFAATDNDNSVALFANRLSSYAHFNLFEREMPLYFNAHPLSRARRHIESETGKYEKIGKYSKKIKREWKRRMFGCAAPISCRFVQIAFLRFRIRDKLKSHL